MSLGLISRSALSCVRRPSALYGVAPLLAFRSTYIRKKSTLFSPTPRKTYHPVPSHTSLQLIPDCSPAPLVCWVDAATTSGLVAVVVGNTYKVFRLKEGWNETGRDIHWMEMIAFELLIQVLLSCQYVGEVTVYSDSTAALRAFVGGKTKIQSIKECRERIQVVQSFLPFSVRPQWVQGKYNLADQFSRGKPAKGYEKLTCKVTIPEALEQFVHCD